MNILETTQEYDVRVIIRLYLKKSGITKRHLANGIDVSEGHLALILKLERKLTEENLDKINQVLGQHFTMTQTVGEGMKATG